jgi:hypothetical protein
MEAVVRTTKAFAGNTKTFAYNLFGLVLLLLAAPAFGQVPGSPGDTLMHTLALYCTNQLVWYGGGAAIVVGGLKHATSHGERGHGWIYAGASGLAVAASARSILGLTGAVGAL